MNRAIAAGGAFAIGVAVGGTSTELVRTQAPQYATTQILQQDLKNLPGQEILVFKSTWQPGFKLPLHVHPNGHEITYVVDGEQTFDIQGVGTKVVRAGEAIYTPPNTPHYGWNATTKVSTTIVIRVKDKDKPIMVEIKK